MKCKRFAHWKKQEKHTEEPKRDALPPESNPEELYRLAAETCWSYSMLPLCGFPEGLWYFF